MAPSHPVIDHCHAKLRAFSRLDQAAPQSDFVTKGQARPVVFGVF
jgi:hypothetical protein